MTYSVVARCPDTGNFGVAVATRNLAVGYQVPWVQAGVGALASQGDTNFAYGHLAFDLMESGVSVADALGRITDDDEHRASRQVGLVGMHGDGAAFTGEMCLRYGSHVVGDGVAFQANAMRNEGVPEAMAGSWASTGGDAFEDRLLAALVAAENAGGDIRGRQSAAIKVVPAQGAPWDVLVDLRVDDHVDPLGEIQRLSRMSKAYRAVEEASVLKAGGDVAGAENKWASVAEALPDMADGVFWQGVFLAGIGKPEEAKASFSTAFSLNHDFREVAVRLIENGSLDPSALP